MPAALVAAPRRDRRRRRPVLHAAPRRRRVLVWAPRRSRSRRLDAVGRPGGERLDRRCERTAPPRPPPGGRRSGRGPDGRRAGSGASTCGPPPPGSPRPFASWPEMARCYRPSPDRDGRGRPGGGRRVRRRRRLTRPIPSALAATSKVTARRDERQRRLFKAPKPVGGPCRAVVSRCVAEHRSSNPERSVRARTGGNGSHP